ncbi:sensor histidine kinase [Marinigracilibium pacificum]|uniref:Histidine kinase n=1 Tax=Marinigracilibium pacificum TaxID=2729599 RepID=A0A848IXD6_9BACT|nr:histidine kinase [Marinigracilibium pacificum]NMM48967.1 histidine kinase [Marinigracilibium pacificum]
MSDKLKSTSGLILIYVILGLLLSYLELLILKEQKSLVLLSNLSFFILSALFFLPVPQIISFLNPGFQKLFQLIISYFLLTALIIFVAHMGSRGLTELASGENIPFWSDSFYLKLLIAIPSFIGTLIFFYSKYYYQAFKEHVLAEADWKAQRTEVELNLLKARLNPHFLFNALNSLAALSITQSDKMPAYLGKLSAFLRTILSKRSEKIVEIEEEMEQIRRYIALEKLRFGDRLEWIEELDPNSKNVKIPVFIFQPIIENAIKHGVNESDQPIKIRFSGEVKNGFFNVSIINDLGQMPSQKKGTGWGLENVRKQLALIYGRSDLLEVIKNSNNFIVKIHFPLDQQFDL